jgi:7-carboxy-7-deazaguanine synthase
MSRIYTVKETYYTLQGEGANTGRVAVFLRFSGCNLWTGREEDRHKAICQFCDTDFLETDGPGGGRFKSPQQLAEHVSSFWPDQSSLSKFVVCTGGEPLLQLDRPLIAALKERSFEVAVETNGTIEVPAGIDWICVSPKAGAQWVQKQGDELKLVFPHEGLSPQECVGLPFRYFYLQPMDGPNLQENTQKAIQYCLQHPQWRLSIQTHKQLGIP